MKHNLNISDPEYAEAIFYFVSQEDIFEDFCEKSIEEDISIAEYVQRYKLEEFRNWYSETY